jgi:hypothetical protein
MTSLVIEPAKHPACSIVPQTTKLPRTPQRKTGPSFRRRMRTQEDNIKMDYTDQRWAILNSQYSRVVTNCTFSFNLKITGHFIYMGWLWGSFISHSKL